MSFFLATTTSTTDSVDLNIIEPTTKQLNALQRWWANINWEDIIAIAIQKSINILLVILLFFILSRIAKFIVDRSFKTYRKRVISDVRVRTLHTLVQNIVQYTFGFFLVYSILSILGIPIGSLLAGAGIAGLAVGLGAQGFMNDLITGFFIISEQQIDIDDEIQLKNLNLDGKVIAVGIRTLQLQAYDGTIHFIPNRNITLISNTSRANMRVQVDLRINPQEGLNKIQETANKANQEIFEKNQDSIVTPPEIFGIVDLGNNNFAIRTIMYVLNGQQSRLQEQLLSTQIEAFTQADITIIR